MTTEKRVYEFQMKILLNPVAGIPLSGVSYHQMVFSAGIMAEFLANYEEREGKKLETLEVVSAAEQVAETIATLQNPLLATILKDYRSRAVPPFGGHYVSEEEPLRAALNPRIQMARAEKIQLMISDVGATKALLLKIVPNNLDEAAWMLAKSIVRCEEFAAIEFDDSQVYVVAERVAHGILTFKDPLFCGLFRDYCSRSSPFVGGHYVE